MQVDQARDRKIGETGVMSDETEPSSIEPSRQPADGFPIPPTPAGPSDVPSDADRQAVVVTIQQAMAEDLVPFEDVDERFARVYDATTQAELRAIVDDLPDLRRQPPRPEARHLAPSSSIKVLGDTKISGWLAVDGDISVVTLIGDVLVDLSTAEIPSDGLTITVVSLIGDVKVILPDGVRVQSQGSSLIGDSKERLSPPLANQPTIRIKGFLAIGDVAVYSLSEVPVGKLRKLWASLRGKPIER
jgi:hypothetical protein